MAEINLPDYTLLWASAGDVLKPSDNKIQQGWSPEIPPRQWFNWLDNRQDEAIAHIIQHGIPVWSDKIEYQTNKSYVQGSDGNIYVSTALSVNQNPVTDVTNSYWKLAFQDTLSPAHGQCRLAISSPTAIKLSPYNGNSLVIAGTARKIPTAGVTLNNSGMSINTLYYIYAFWAGTAISMEFSTTGHSADPTTGVEIKTGDSSRSLVGMVYTNSSSQFSDGPASRLVASWFNRRAVGGSITTSGNINFSNTSSTEVSTGVRISFLNWNNETVDIKVTGQFTNNTATQSVAVTAYVDNTSYGNISGAYIVTAGGGTGFSSCNSLTPTGGYLAEGYHTSQVYGSVTAGTGTITYMTNSIITRI